MIKYFLKDNFCLFIYNFSHLFTIFRFGCISQRAGCISQRAGCISQRTGCKKTARCESRISQLAPACQLIFQVLPMAGLLERGWLILQGAYSIYLLVNYIYDNFLQAQLGNVC